MRIRLQPPRRPRNKRPPVKVNIVLLSLPVRYLHLINKLAQRPSNFPTTAAVEDASVKNFRCQLRDTVRLTALAVLGRACRQYQDGFNDNDTGINNLFAEENSPHNDCVNRPSADNKAAFYRSRRPVQQRLREMYLFPQHRRKVFARILLNRLNNHLEEGLLPPGHQCAKDSGYTPTAIQRCTTSGQLWSTYLAEDSEGSHSSLEVNRITATKAKREARKSQLPPPRNFNTQPSPPNLPTMSTDAPGTNRSQRG
nr:unnamed protein product [Spirometra erinaceieuropaei]